MLFTFPSRYCFTIDRQDMFSLTRWSSQIPTGFPGSRSTRVPSHSAPMLSPTGLSPSAAGLSRPLRLAWPHHCLLAWARIKRSHDPQPATPQGFYARSGLGLFPVRSPLLRESLLFSFPPGTEMVQFPRFPPLRLCVHLVVSTPYTWMGSPIRKSTDLCSLAAPRGLSQLATSFFGAWRLGIHRAPFTTCPFNARSQTILRISTRADAVRPYEIFRIDEVRRSSVSL